MNKQIKKQLSLLSIIIFIICSENYCGTTFSKVMREMVTNEMRDLKDQLIKAAITGNLPGIQDALDKGANIEAFIETKYSRTVLNWAAKLGHIEIAKFLLSRGANIDATDDLGYTGLIWAASNGHTDMVKLLLDNGANVNKEAIGGHYNRTALIEAAKKNHVQIINLLLDNGANMEVATEYGNTALIYAAQEGHTETVRALLNKGANIEVKDKLGNTALMYASQRGRIETVKLLLVAGANVEAEDITGNTALILGARSGQTETVTFLLDAGANIEAENRESNTALILAARHNYIDKIDMLNILIEAGAIAPDPEKYTGIRDDAKNILDTARQAQLERQRPGRLTKNAAKKNCVAATYEAAEDDWTKVKELIKQLDQPVHQVIFEGLQEPQAQLVGQGQLTKSAARV